jgi:hypothetical protein
MPTLAALAETGSRHPVAANRAAAPCLTYRDEQTSRQALVVLMLNPAANPASLSSLRR